MSEKKENIHAGHRERMRQRYKTNGFEGFMEHEILEMLLFYAMPRCDTNAIAHQLIERFSSFSGVLDAEIEDLTQVKGVGESAAIFLTMLPEAFRAYRMSKEMKKEAVCNHRDIKKFIEMLYVHEVKEQIYVICLDTKLKILCAKKVGDGNCNSSEVMPRNIVEIALRHRSSNVIIAHNHPDGSSLPSEMDLRMTRRLNNLFQMIGIELYDHYIVGKQINSLRMSGCWDSII